MSDLSRRIANLPPEKRALLEKRLAQQKSLEDARKSIPRAAVSDRYQLSFCQERLWFLDQLEPGSPMYNILKAVRISGKLDIASLQRALDKVLAKHISLRTNFTSTDGIPYQFIREIPPIELPVLDLSHLSGDMLDSEISRIGRDEVWKPFDLLKDLLIRFLLLRIQAEEHLLIFVVHHIVFDGWSMSVFVRDIAETCESLEADLQELPIQYVDYAAWQRERLQGDVLDKQLLYWKSRLGDDFPALDLPTDYPRPAVQSYRGDRITRTLPSDLVSRLKAFSQAEGATMFMTLLTAFKILLSSYTGRGDIVVGCPIAGRTKVETEQLIGFFVNMLVIRTNIERKQSFRELLRQVREVSLGAYAHQDLPFEKLVEELQPERNPSRTPLFQVVFNYRNIPPASVKTKSLKMDVIDLESGIVRFDLDLEITENSEGLFCTFDYNSDLFKPETIHRMLDHYEVLLKGITTEPDKPVKDIPILTNAELHRQLIEWNDTATDYPKDAALHRLFEQQVERTPDAVAVEFPDGVLTYRELNRRANRLAYHLRDLGVQDGSMVGLCVDRSAEMIVGMLAILKAGGAYVPLDPDYPSERLSFMIKDAGVTVLLGKKQLINQVSTSGVTCVCMETDGELVVGNPDSNLSCSADGESIAYVIYTSGSTGTPKGIAVPHRAVSRLVLNTNYVSLGPSDVVAQASNSSFDAATFEIWGALLNGARLVGIQRDTLLSPHDLAGFIRSKGVTTLFLTTALFNRVAMECPSAFSPLECLLFGGEAVDPGCVRKVLQADPPKRLLHVYGPTENTTFTTWYEVCDVPEDAVTVPIGRPISNTQVYVQDSYQQPVPVGVEGELVISGDGLAVGYLGRPELTAEKFIQNPFGEGRFYRTGDLVRQLNDGSIVFVGRLDDQVKIRGFRIEPAEIESALKKHPNVRDAVVIAREDTPGERYLAAYVVPQDSRPVLSEELRSFLSASLPDYMVPAHFIKMDSLPTTPGGKLDKRSLPVPEVRPVDKADNLAAPRDLLEAQLVRIWEKLFGSSPIGIKDNFFELGGHSLMAVRLFAQIEKATGIRLPLAILFQAPTIEKLAEVLRSKGLGDVWNSLVPIQPGGSHPPIFCIHTAGGNVLVYHDLAVCMGKDQPVYGLQAQGLDGKQPPHERIEDMAAHYIEEIRRFQPEGPYHLIGYSFGGLIAFEMACMLQEQRQDVGLLALLDTQGPGDQSYQDPTYSNVAKRVYLHSKHISSLGLRSKLQYVQSKAKRLWKTIVTPAKYLIVKLLDEAWKAAGRPFPRALRSALWFSIYSRKAARSYVPRTYSGKVVLFRAEKQPIASRLGPDLGWSKFVTGGIEIHEVPGDHVVLKPPGVSVLADKLKACLQQVNSNEPV